MHFITPHGFPSFGGAPPRSSRLVTMLLAVLSSWALPVAGQSDDENVEIRVVAVAGNIHMLEGRGGNIGVSVGPDGILIVDDQFAPLAPKIEAALAGLDSGPLRFVLNTHHHGDHTGGNAVFAGKGATIVAHRNVRTHLAAGGSEAAALPVITFDQSASVHFNGEEIRLIHHGPGHTDGDSVIHFTRANVVHMGDLFFKDRFPFVDLDHGGSVPGYVDSVATVLARIPADARVIPGHGDLATVADLRRFHAVLVETGELIRRARNEGKSLEAVREAGLPEQYRDWGSGFISTDRWIETVYRDATPGPGRRETP